MVKREGVSLTNLWSPQLHFSGHLHVYVHGDQGMLHTSATHTLIQLVSYSYISKRKAYCKLDHN